MRVFAVPLSSAGVVVSFVVDPSSGKMPATSISTISISKLLGSMVSSGSDRFGMFSFTSSKPSGWVYVLLSPPLVVAILSPTLINSEMCSFTSPLPVFAVYDVSWLCGTCSYISIPLFVA
uniref:Secreted protein n=1 Tax=Anopheles merus TaxID=30066 RepID=A0A182UUB2_ANOME